MATEAAAAHLGPDERVWRSGWRSRRRTCEVALAWAAEHDWALAVDLAVALWPYWDAGWGSGRPSPTSNALLSKPTPPDETAGTRGPDLVAADMAANQGDARKGGAVGPRGDEGVRTVDDETAGRARMVALGAALGGEGGLLEAAAVLAEATAEASGSGDDVLAARSLNRRHFVAARMGDHREAEELGQRELARWWARSGSTRGQATALRHLAVTAFRFGDLDHADALCERAMTIWREVDDRPAVAHVQTTLGDIARERGDVPRATALYRAALVDLQAIGDRRCEASTCKNLADILASRRRTSRAPTCSARASRSGTSSATRPASRSASRGWPPRCARSRGRTMRHPPRRRGGAA